MLGDSKGGFKSAPHYPVELESRAWDLVVADVNGDGKADLVAATGETIDVLLGDGVGEGDRGHPEGARNGPTAKPLRPPTSPPPLGASTLPCRRSLLCLHNRLEGENGERLCQNDGQQQREQDRRHGEDDGQDPASGRAPKSACRPEDSVNRLPRPQTPSQLKPHASTRTMSAGTRA